MSEQERWQRVYESKPSDVVSWFQAGATLSLDLIRHIGTPREAAIIDVGGGASTLVDGPLAEGFGDPMVFDFSDAALRVTRNRLGARGEEAHWIVDDITGVDLPEATYDVWHDRAVSHFLTTAEACRAYVHQAMKAVHHGDRVITTTFTADGPTECSNLPVMHYDTDELRAEFGSAFQLTEHRDEHHVTPTGRVQHFIYCHCLKRLRSAPWLGYALLARLCERLSMTFGISSSDPSLISSRLEENLL